jgi:hypothetical protein
MKQETLEEVAENGWFNTNSMSAEHKEGFIEGFIQGANYQAERMYSEEEMYSALQKLRLEIKSGVQKWQEDFEFDLDRWFEQFKKK